MELQFEPTRVYGLDGGGRLVAEITFPCTPPGIYTIDHTFVDPSLRGQGMADKLVRAALEQIRKNGGKMCIRDSVYTLHKVLPPLFSHLQSQHITCPALCGVSDLELAQKAAAGQALQPQGIAYEVGVAGVVHMAVDVCIAVPHPPPVPLLHLSRHAQLGEGQLLAQPAACLLYTSRCV